VDLSVDSQQRELALGFLDKRVKRVTLIRSELGCHLNPANGRGECTK